MPISVIAMTLFLATLALAASTLGAPGEPIDAVFDYVGNDSLGSAFSFALQQRMTSSTLYKIKNKRTLPDESAKVSIELVSLNVGNARSGLLSTISLVTIVHCDSGQRVVRHELILISPDSLNSMVKKTLTDMDQDIVHGLAFGCDRPLPSQPQNLSTVGK
jgi:hypothetical protein